MDQKHKKPKSGDHNKIQKRAINHSQLSSEDLNEGDTPIQKIRQSSFNYHMKTIEQNCKKILSQSTETNRDPLLIQEHLILSNYFFCVPGIGTKGFSISNSNIINNTDPPSTIEFCNLLSHCEKNIMDHNCLYIMNEKHFVIVDKGVCTVKYYLIKKYDQKKMYDHKCFLKNEGTSYLTKEGNIQKGINYTFD